MFPILFLIFVIVPIVEIYFLIQVGSIIGTGWTILAVVSTAIIGSLLIKQQGRKAMNELQQTMQQGQMPAQVMFDGFCILISGAFLLTPGFFTDAFGFLLLVPMFRKILFAYLAARRNMSFTQSNYASHNTQKSSHEEANRTIDVDSYYEIKDDEK